ncbi:uncharacterized protein LOC106066778 [Biomphalaria glabrata]|uniref:Uncharacterized protein LOC106066778 n=1 Tax=Biomphalaria glabrata TaxID=6526 RepID=A0A9U8EBJ7_BIOGL|nr:uncharacterized protein LOC106066778 [Biomphalaria glabrata]XP_013081316.2 uncharacterized protein LOC106066778 [Biomphalaria glabrata]KAI8748855.1 hypothetical protein BgiMline_018287 [Biomphalaria glabrata]
MEEKVKDAIQQAQVVIDDFKKLIISFADIVKGKLDIILLLAQQLAAKVRKLSPLMTEASQTVKDAIAEAKSAKTVLHQLKDTISSIKNDPSRTLEEALLNQTSTVVQKVTDNVQEVEAMEALLPVLLEKQYELIALYEQLNVILDKDKTLADKEEMKDLKKEMEHLVSVIYRQKDTPGASAS